MLLVEAQFLRLNTEILTNKPYMHPAYQRWSWYVPLYEGTSNETLLIKIIWEKPFLCVSIHLNCISSCLSEVERYGVKMVPAEVVLLLVASLVCIEQR